MSHFDWLSVTNGLNCLAATQYLLAKLAETSP